MFSYAYLLLLAKGILYGLGSWGSILKLKYDYDNYQFDQHIMSSRLLKSTPDRDDLFLRDYEKYRYLSI